MLQRVGNNSIAKKIHPIFSAMLWRVEDNSIAEKSQMRRPSMPPATVTTSPVM